MAQIECVGCHYRTEACARMMDDAHWMDHLTLEYEPENDYDPGAIAIRHRGETVGYVPKHKQAEVRPYVGKPLKWALVETRFQDHAQTVLKWVSFEVSE